MYHLHEFKNGLLFTKTVYFVFNFNLFVQRFHIKSKTFIPFDGIKKQLQNKNLINKNRPTFCCPFYYIMIEIN